MICVRGQKGSDGRGLHQTEETMTLITRFELASKATSESYALHREALKPRQTRVCKSAAML
jgi:hypothetical protein